ELIAYFVGEKDQSLKELKEFLLEKLPEYMIQDKYVKLDKFPLTRNGKIDSKKLLELKGNLILSGVEYIAPETEKEKLLEEVIKNILGVEKVSMEDDFFFLGGNSLKLIELISKLKQLGFNLNIAEVVKKPKVKQIASLLEEVVFEENII
ncbi:non-ribosomal peptide synthetase, partial [Rhodobacteraceae bacterium 4F10]